MGSTMILRMRREQTSITLSTIEAKYIATRLATCEEVWPQKLFIGLFDHVLEPTMIYYDNQSWVKMTKNLLFHDRSKHIEIKYHFIHDIVQKRDVKLQYVFIHE